MINIGDWFIVWMKLTVLMMLAVVPQYLEVFRLKDQWTSTELISIKMKKANILFTALLLYLTVTFFYLLIYPDRLIVTGRLNEHDLIVRDRLFHKDTILVENAYAYPNGFRFVGYTKDEISKLLIYSN